jgi:hypothetical protein
MKSGEQVKDLKLSTATQFNTVNDFASDHITVPAYSDHNLQPPGLNGEDLNHAMVLLNDLLIASYAAQKADAQKAHSHTQPLYAVDELPTERFKSPVDISSLSYCADKTVRKVF